MVCGDSFSSMSISQWILRNKSFFTIFLTLFGNKHLTSRYQMGKRKTIFHNILWSILWTYILFLFWIGITHEIIIIKKHWWHRNIHTRSDIFVDECRIEMWMKRTKCNSISCYSIRIDDDDDFGVYENLTLIHFACSFIWRYPCRHRISGLWSWIGWQNDCRRLELRIYKTEYFDNIESIPTSYIAYIDIDWRRECYIENEINIMK